VDGSEADTITPTLVINKSTDPDLDTIDYIFEIDTVNTFDSPDLQISDDIYGESETISWTIPSELADNTVYYWRAKANDGSADSLWTDIAEFFVNLSNDAPEAPTLNNPADNSEVTTSRRNCHSILRMTLTMTVSPMNIKYTVTAG